MNLFIRQAARYLLLSNCYNFITLSDPEPYSQFLSIALRLEPCKHRLILHLNYDQAVARSWSMELMLLDELARLEK